MKKNIFSIIFSLFAVCTYSQESASKFKYKYESYFTNSTKVIFEDTINQNILYSKYKNTGNSIIMTLSLYDISENIIFDFDTLYGQFSIYNINVRYLNDSTLQFITNDINQKIHLIYLDLKNHVILENKTLEETTNNYVHLYKDGLITYIQNTINFYNKNGEVLKKVVLPTQTADYLNYRNYYPSIVSDDNNYCLVFADSIIFNDTPYIIKSDDRNQFSNTTFFISTDGLYGYYNKILFKMRLENGVASISHNIKTEVQTYNYQYFSFYPELDKYYKLKSDTLEKIDQDYYYLPNYSVYEDENFGLKIGTSPFTGGFYIPSHFLIDKSDSSYFTIKGGYTKNYFKNLKLNQYTGLNLVKLIKKLNQKYLYHFKSIGETVNSEFLLIDKSKEVTELNAFKVLSKISDNQYLVADNDLNLGYLDIKTLDFYEKIHNDKFINNTSYYNYETFPSFDNIIYKNDSLFVSIFNSKTTISTSKSTDSLDFEIRGNNNPLFKHYFDGKELKLLEIDKEYSFNEKRHSTVNSYILASKNNKKISFLNRENQKEAIIYLTNGSNKTPISIDYYDHNTIAVWQNRKLFLFQNQSLYSYDVKDYGILYSYDYDPESQTFIVICKPNNYLLNILKIKENEITIHKIDIDETSNRSHLIGKNLIFSGKIGSESNFIIDCLNLKLQKISLSNTNEKVFLTRYKNLGLYRNVNYYQNQNAFLIINYNNGRTHEILPSDFGNYENFYVDQNYVIFKFNNQRCTVFDLSDLSITKYDFGLSQSSTNNYIAQKNDKKFFVRFSLENPIFMPIPDNFTIQSSATAFDGDNIYIAGSSNQKATQIYKFLNSPEILKNEYVSKNKILTFLFDENIPTTIIYPNPFYYYFKIQSSALIKDIEIMDFSGKSYGNCSIDNADTLPISAFKNSNLKIQNDLNLKFDKLIGGKYLLIFTYANGKKGLKTVIKE